MGSYAFVLMLGVGAGVAELVSRYRDAPARVLFSLPGLVYLVLNAAAASAALFVIDVFGWKFGVESSATAIRVTQVLVGGFGALALLRSSLLNVRVGDQDVSVGPGGVLLVVLGASDRAVDRLRAEARSSAVARIMAGVSFQKAVEALPTFCLALMQNLPREDQEALANQIKRLGDANMDDDIKSLVLGLSLMNVVGEAVLTSAVKNLGPRIRAATP